MNIYQMIDLIESNKIKNKKEVYVRLNYRKNDYVIDITDIKIDFIKYNMLHLAVKPYVMPTDEINKIECISNKINYIFLLNQK